MSDKFFVGLDLTGVEDNGLQRPVSRVTLLLDDENSVTAGDDTGLELKSDCPHGTQTMADTILAQVKGYQYRMFRADDAALDPSAELGDGVTAGGLYSVLARISEDGSGYTSFSAPGEAELEDEFPTGGPVMTEFNRKVAAVRSQILKTAESITLKVEDEIRGLSGELKLTAESLTSSITATDGKVSSLKQYVDSITLEVSNGSTSSSITLKAGSAVIASKIIQMNGLVTFTGLQNGTTTIDGACIKTGLIAADRLNLTGAITFGDLDLNTQSSFNNIANTASTALSTAQGAASTASSALSEAGAASSRVAGWAYSGTTYIDGSQIMAGTVKASQLLGGTVGLLDAYERNVGGLSITNTQNGWGLEFYTNTGGIRLNANGNIWFESWGGSFGLSGGEVVSGRDLVPLTSGLNLGKSSAKWSDVYAENGTIVTSDREKKKDVAYDLDAYDALFDALRPVRYRLKEGRSGRVHLGLIAQDVEAALAETGVTDLDFAGFIKSPREGGGYDYALRYGELIPLLIRRVQALSARVAELEGRRTA